MREIKGFGFVNALGFGTIDFGVVDGISLVQRAADWTACFAPFAAGKHAKLIEGLCRANATGHAFGLERFAELVAVDAFKFFGNKFEVPAIGVPAGDALVYVETSESGNRFHSLVEILEIFPPDFCLFFEAGERDQADGRFKFAQS